MAKSYVKLNKPVKDYSADELRAKLGGLKQSELMRSIILNEKEFISIDYYRSLRGFWYSTVKPALDKLGLLTENDSTEDGLTKWDAELSRYVAELVRLGKVSYKELMILDTSRQRETPGESYSVMNLETYGYKTGTAAYPNIIVATEKDTAYGIIRDIASFFGCSCISGKGQNSLGAMEDLLRQMTGNDQNYAEPIYILTMTDYDPAGYYIAETFRQQVEDLRAGLNIASPVHIERIGITPDQLSAEEVEANKYTPKPANMDKWMKATGGINGEAKGLELDALTPDRIRKIFVGSLKPYIDLSKYTAFARAAYLQKIVLETIQPQIEAMVQEIIRDEVGGVEVVDYDIFNIAERGSSSLPIDDICRTARRREVERAALSYFIEPVRGGI